MPNHVLATVMEILENSRETRWRYAVIAKPTHTYRAPLHRISKEIADTIANQLGTYITASDVIYKSPNFIINLHNHHLQRQALLSSTLWTRSFCLELVPWSKEHELAKLPWIVADPTGDLKISIDPLTILPVPSQLQTQTGNKALKDTYASMIGVDYDLTAPDYSYLVIAELRDFYHQKFEIFRTCKSKTIQMQHLLQGCLRQFQNQATTIHDTIQALANNVMDDRYRCLCDFAGHLGCDANHACMKHTIIGQHIHLIQAQSEEPINLNGFKRISPFHQVPVPARYVTRLKAIYAAVTKAVYGAEGIITTTETSTCHFEASVTIQGSTRRFNEVVTSLNNLSLHIGLLQSCASYVTTDLDEACKGFNRLLKEYNVASHSIESINYLDNAVAELGNTMKSYYNKIITLADEFSSSEIQFFCTYLDTESLTVVSDRWLQAEKPANGACD